MPRIRARAAPCEWRVPTAWWAYLSIPRTAVRAFGSIRRHLLRRLSAPTATPDGTSSTALRRWRLPFHYPWRSGQWSSWLEGRHRALPLGVRILIGPGGGAGLHRYRRGPRQFPSRRDLQFLRQRLFVQF